ncbi:Uma2 family endonuclease [Actinomadura namibiensis]|uniref:Uma2 family endonuclease n=1 Tax=Actinomadura kijaniata TaxID=46161 RepID=UPI001602449C|nr:Uma2 family endonuclease [Actinomadura namibiensis]
MPDWLIPPPEGFTAEDLDRLPQLPPRTELIDGALVLASPRAIFHTLVLSFLEHALRQASPKTVRVRREITVRLAKRQRPEPDLLVLRAGTAEDRRETSYRAEDVVLAVEVVSPESEERDRMRKPQLYAKAGIPHFWRVEEQNGYPVVYVYELDPSTGQYVATGVHRDSLRVSVPFDIELDLKEIDKF